MKKYLLSNIWISLKLLMCCLSPNINTVRRLIILQKNVLWIMNFKNQLFHLNPLFSSNNILKFGDKITLENILFLSESINREVPSIVYDWFTFSGSLRRNENCWSVTNYLNIPIFWTQKYGRCYIRASAILSWYVKNEFVTPKANYKNYKILSNKIFCWKLLIVF